MSAKTVKLTFFKTIEKHSECNVLGKACAFSVVLTLNVLLLAMETSGCLAQMAFSSQIGDALADAFRENVDDANWAALAEDFGCCPAKTPSANDTASDELVCCAKAVFAKGTIKLLFPVIALLILLAAVVLSVCCCRITTEEELRERKRRKWAKEEQQMIERRKKLQAGIKKVENKQKAKEAKEAKKLAKKNKGQVGQEGEEGNNEGWANKLKFWQTSKDEDDK